MISLLTKLGLTVVVLLLPLTTLAQEFIPLVGIPFIPEGTQITTLSQYANAFYIAAISLGAVIAVLKIIFAGVKYMLSDVITDKSAAKADIKGAVLGLILIIGAVLLLRTISPDIISLRAFNLNALSVPPPPAQPAPPIDSATSYCESLEESDECITVSCPMAPGDTGAEARCRASCSAQGGTLFIDSVYRGTSAVCAISNEQRIQSLIAEWCPPGETCVAEACENYVFSCASECDDAGEFFYDENIDACIQLSNAEDTQLEQLAEAECPDGRSCRAEPCDTSGTFYNCQSQCLQERNGVYYDENTLACVFYDDSYDPVVIPITVDPEQTYYQRQTEDEIAAGESPVEIRIVDTDVTGGFVTVEYPDGRQVELSCGYVVPNLCAGTP